MTDQRFVDGVWDAAFPVAPDSENCGLTKREYIAAQVLGSLVVGEGMFIADAGLGGRYARVAVHLADELLAALGEDRWALAGEEHHHQTAKGGTR
jgi:hypothetical protein